MIFRDGVLEEAIDRARAQPPEVLKPTNYGVWRKQEQRWHWDQGQELHTAWHLAMGYVIQLGLDGIEAEVRQHGGKPR